MIKAIAIDDEPLALEVLTSLCGSLNFIDLKRTFTQSSSAIRYLKQHPVDLLFLDINMPDISGIELYKSVNQDVMVIFTTAFSEYAVQGFELNATDYLLKPIKQKRFEQACLKVQEFYDFKKSKEVHTNNFIYVRSAYSLVKIPLSDILFFQTMDDYIKIHRVNAKPTLTLLSMKKLLQMLPREKFIRIHRSFGVSIEKIEAVRAKTVIIKEHQLPIGVTYEKTFFDSYQRSSF